MGVLDGKAIVVTGSGRGLGRAYARAAAKSGASVVVNDVVDDVVAVAAEIEADGGDVAVSRDSVADPSSAEAIIAKCVDSFGKIDGLVNNAGLLVQGDPWELTPDAIERLVGVNLAGTLYCGIAAMRHMRQQSSGVIVNVTSGAHVGIPGLSLYGATKGAIASLVYTWALDLAPHGIRVSGISPLGRTAIGLPTGTPVPQGGDSPDPDTVAPAIVYLLSDAASHLSGQILRFDGQQLSLLSLPRFADPRAERPAWDHAEIGRALDNELGDAIQPVGMAATNLRHGAN